MGVWIETGLMLPDCRSWSVTPCMGVWIETDGQHRFCYRTDVTPCMGVWIETDLSFDENYCNRSHPVWVCGLKLLDSLLACKSISHTLYGCVD